MSPHSCSCSCPRLAFRVTVLSVFSLKKKKSFSNIPTTKNHHLHVVGHPMKEFYEESLYFSLSGTCFHSIGVADESL